MPENRGYLPEGAVRPAVIHAGNAAPCRERRYHTGGDRPAVRWGPESVLTAWEHFRENSQRGSHRSVDQRCRPGDRRFITGRKTGLFYGGIPLRRRERRADGPALPPEGPGTGYGGNAPRSEAGSRGGGKGGAHGALRGLRRHWPGHRGSAAYGVHLRRPHPPSQRAVPGGAENSGSGQGL